MNNSHNSQLNKEITNLKSDASQLMTDLNDVATALVNVGRDSAGDAKEKIEKEIQKKFKSLQSTYEETKMKGKKLASQFEREVETHPYRSVLIAVGAGFLVSALLKLRK
jgi:ElaB/YqjD/DUF883 family membrane-anchored ribosome-binding protein